MGFVIARVVVTCLAASPGEGSTPGRFEFDGTEMAASIKVILYEADGAAAKRAAEAALKRIRDLNSVFSDFDPESELSRVCRVASEGKEVSVSDDLWRILSRAEEISRASKGTFDVTIDPMVRLWRRARRLHALPSPERLAEARALVDHRLLRLDPGRRTVRLLKPGMRIDLGGIAKGYAAGEALEVLRARGVTCALVAIGGDIALGCAPPGAPGWRIAIASHEKEPFGVRHLWLSGVCVSTSGDSEQFVVIDGRRYSHIVDPRTGLGLTDRGLVTVVAPDGATADALATAVSVLDPREGMSLIEGTRGAAGRIVRCPEGEMELHESERWKALRAAEPPPSPGTVDPGKGGLDFECLVSGLLSPAGDPAASPKPGENKFDPTVTPPVDWMLAPVPLPAAKAETEAEMKPYTEKIPGTDVTFEMAPIPGGKFLMGSPPQEPSRGADEGPQIEVELEPFWMGRREVRWGEYELWGLGYDALRKEQTKQEADERDRLADAITRPTRPYSDMTFGMGREGYPAICMTQLAAKIYCKWLSAKTGRYYRLPTEAEWEYACRAGTTTAYSFGDDPKALKEYAWYFDTSDDKYHPVGEKKPNPWGLFDMHGNVAEWVLDRYIPEGYKGLEGKARRNPLVVPEAIHPRSARGGSWMDDPERLRCAARRGSQEEWNKGDPQMPRSIWYLTDGVFVGFRVVRPLRVPAAAEAVQYDLDPTEKQALADYLEFLGGRK